MLEWCSEARLFMLTGVCGNGVVRLNFSCWLVFVGIMKWDCRLFMLTSGCGDGVVRLDCHAVWCLRGWCSETVCCNLLAQVDPQAPRWRTALTASPIPWLLGCPSASSCLGSVSSSVSFSFCSSSVLLYIHNDHKDCFRDGEPRMATSTFTQLLSCPYRSVGWFYRGAGGMMVL